MVSYKAVWLPSSHSLIGVGNPNFFLVRTDSGRTFLNASRRRYLVVLPLHLRLSGKRAARCATSISRNGTLNSRECAIVILSALARISPTSQVLISMYCILVESLNPFASQYKISRVALDIGLPRQSLAISAGWKTEALPMYQSSSF